MTDINELDRFSIRRFARTLTGLTGHAVLLVATMQISRGFGASLACPDWPLCYGHVVPEFDVPIFLSWVVRAVTALTGMAFASIAVQAASHAVIRRNFGGFTALLGVLLGALVVLQGASVYSLGSPVIVALEMAVALAFLAATFVLTHRARAIGNFATPNPVHRIPGEVRIAFVVLAALIGLLIISGTLVQAYGAQGVCPDFPTCRGEWLPRASLAASLVMIHRFGGAFLLLMSLGLGAACLRLSLPRFPLLTLRCLPLLIVIQTGLGILGAGAPIAVVVHVILALLAFWMASTSATEICLFGGAFSGFSRTATTQSRPPAPGRGILREEMGP